MNPVEAINAGRSILDAIMVPNGFHFVDGESGRSSGGAFAQASYVNGVRRLEFSYRYSLGLVNFHFRDLSITHDEYMQFLGHQKDSAYLWYANDSPMTGFEALKHDLELYCQDFLVGPSEILRKVYEAIHHTR